MVVEGKEGEISVAVAGVSSVRGKPKPRATTGNFHRGASIGQQQAAHSAPREHHRFGTAHLLAEAMDKAAVSESDATGSPAMCKACKKEASFMCSACRGAHYCSLECQVGP